MIFEDRAELHGLNIETLRHIREVAIETRKSYQENRQRSAAMICPNQMALAIGRLYQAAGSADANFFLDYRICTNLADASDWLKRDLSDLELPQYALVET
ncbi:MAG: hypothetical protein VCE74_18850 [Alphaproteobacteria bacterium]